MHRGRPRPLERGPICSVSSADPPVTSSAALSLWARLPPSHGNRGTRDPPSWGCRQVRGVSALRLAAPLPPARKEPAAQRHPSCESRHRQAPGPRTAHPLGLSLQPCTVVFPGFPASLFRVGLLLPLPSRAPARLGPSHQCGLQGCSGLGPAVPPQGGSWGSRGRAVPGGGLGAGGGQRPGHRAATGVCLSVSLRWLLGSARPLGGAGAPALGGPKVAGGAAGRWPITAVYWGCCHGTPPRVRREGACYLRSCLFYSCRDGFTRDNGEGACPDG